MKIQDNLLALFIMCITFYACSGEDSADDSKNGYAIESINNKEIIFNKSDGKWYFSQQERKGTILVSLNSETASIAYERETPSCSYRVIDKNTASYELQFTHKVYVPYTHTYAYGFNLYKYTLIFTSNNDGTFTGTRSNGSSNETQKGTFSIK